MLPELPRVLKKSEAAFGILFRHWLKANPSYSCAYELKQTSSSCIAFSALEDHQAIYLQAIKGPKGVLIRVQGTSGEPDYIYLRNCPASVVIKYPSGFVIISIDTFLLERSRSKRKSLLWSRAQELSTVTVLSRATHSDRV